jgi:hypothetical protein
MARASSRTVSFAVQSIKTGESFIVIERSYTTVRRAGTQYVSAAKEFALFDEKGRSYERISSNIVARRDGGERFHVIGVADSIRKTG